MSCPSSRSITPWRREARAWCRLTVGTASGTIAQGVPSIVTLVAVGRLGVVPLASVSLAGMLVYGACEVAWIGLALGQGALVAQAAGARKYVAAYGWTALALGVGLAVAAAVLTPLFLVGHLVIAAVVAGSPDGDGVDAVVAREYLWASAPVPLIACVSHALCGHLSAVQRVGPVAAIDVVGAVVDVGATLLLVLGADVGGGWVVPRLGAAGAGYANVISSGVTLVLSVWAFARCSMPPLDAAGDGDGDGSSVNDDDDDGDSGRSFATPLLLGAAAPGIVDAASAAAGASADADDAALSGVAPRHDVSAHAAAVAAVSAAAVVRFACRPRHVCTFATQAGGVAASLALEIGSETAIGFLAAGLGGTAAAVSNSLGECFEFACMVPYAAYQSTSVRVGHLLGAGRIAAARRVGVVAGAALCVWVGAVSAALLAGRSVIGRAFSDDADVVDGVASLVPAFLAAYATFTLYITLCSVLDGQGRAALYPVASVVAAGVMLTLAVASAKATELGLDGLWGASACAYLAASAVAAAFVARSDWHALAALARARSDDVDSDSDADADSGTESAKAARHGGAD